VIDRKQRFERMGMIWNARKKRIVSQSLFCVMLYLKRGGRSKVVSFETLSFEKCRPKPATMGVGRIFSSGGQ